MKTLSTGKNYIDVYRFNPKTISGYYLLCDQNMNLLMKYVPNTSGYAEGITHDPERN
ncbi:MAG: hypothetical protein ACI9SC_002029 [Gammaproteobacteria bacterium]|jgi:hypothetical protein